MGHFRDTVVIAALGMLLIAGCVNVYPPQFPENHPANANAPQTPLVIRSEIGAYRLADAARAEDGMKGMAHAQTPSSGAGATESRPRAGQQMDHGRDARGVSAAGRPGVVERASRTIRVAALDTMRFDPQTIQVKAGETVRFVVTNKGKLPHEFVIGTPQEQQQHAKMMQRMPGMKHEDENALHLAPGETKTLMWQFGSPGVVDIGCHEPGHYPAGMVAKAIVAEDGRASVGEARPATSGGASGTDHSRHQHGK